MGPDVAVLGEEGVLRPRFGSPSIESIVILDSWYLISTVLLVTPAVVIGVQSCLALLPPLRIRDCGPVRRCVLIPLVDAAAALQDTLSSLAGQLGPGDEVVVVARRGVSRCEPPRTLSVRWIEVEPRSSSSQFVDAGVAALASSPPDVLVVVDPGCEFAPGALFRLTQRAVESRRVVLSAVSTDVEPGTGWVCGPLVTLQRFEHFVRPLGGSWIGVPCAVDGGAVALEWPIVAEDPHGLGSWLSDELPFVAMTEDDCAPLFEPLSLVDRCEEPRPRRVFPALRRVLWKAWRDRDGRAALLALHLATPRIDRYLAILVIGGCAIDLGSSLRDGPLAGQLWWVALALTVFAIAVTWVRFLGRYGPLGVILVTIALGSRGLGSVLSQVTLRRREHPDSNRISPRAVTTGGTEICPECGVKVDDARTESDTQRCLICAEVDDWFADSSCALIVESS